MEELFKQNGRTMEFDRDRVALEVKKYRLAHQLTQKQLGERWGVSRYVIIRVENSQNISWESAYRIMAMLTEDMRKEGGV